MISHVNCTDLACDLDFRLICELQGAVQVFGLFVLFFIIYQHKPVPLRIRTEFEPGTTEHTQTEYEHPRRR